MYFTVEILLLAAAFAAATTVWNNALVFSSQPGLGLAVCTDPVSLQLGMEDIAWTQINTLLLY